MYCKIELENYMSHFFVKKSITFDIQTLFYMVQFTFTVKRLHLPLNYEGYRAVDVYNGIECSTWNRASKF